MDTLIISTGLDGFIMPDRILHMTENTICLIKNFQNKATPLYIGIETLAQTGALHRRYRDNFKRHAFLLGINRFQSDCHIIEPGILTVTGVLGSRSKEAFSYDLKGEFDGRTILTGRFSFAVLEYNPDFKKARLEEHYKQVIACLLNDTKTR